MNGDSGYFRSIKMGSGASSDALGLVGLVLVGERVDAFWSDKGGLILHNGERNAQRRRPTCRQVILGNMIP